MSNEQHDTIAKIGHLHGIIDELHAVIRGMEQRIEADARRIKELEDERDCYKTAIARDLQTEWMPVAEHQAAIRRIAELEALVGRMDEIANNDSYAEKLSAIAAGLDNSIWLLDDEDDPETITESWHLAPCPKCGQPVSGEASFDKDTGIVYHPACLGLPPSPEPEPIVWCSCKPEKIDSGTCPDCGGEMTPF